MKPKHAKRHMESAKANLWWIGVGKDTKFSDLRKEHIKRLIQCADDVKFQNFPGSNKSREQNFFELLMRRANYM
jgi:hypothetical protein